MRGVPLLGASAERRFLQISAQHGASVGGAVAMDLYWRCVKEGALLLATILSSCRSLAPRWVVPPATEFARRELSRERVVSLACAYTHCCGLHRPRSPQPALG